MYPLEIKKRMGYVDFYAEGADTEAFLNVCIKQGMEIREPRKNGYRLFAKISASEYKKLKNPAKKHGIKLKIIKKHGFYFFARKNRNRIGFLLGFSLIILFTLFMNMFIWNINVVGNKKVETEKILSDVKNMGLVTGTLSGKHFVQDIEWYLLRENEGLASAEINIQGSVANISVNETTDKVDMKYDDDVPVNIVASKYGVIRKMDVFDGQDVVKVGDAVMKGELLVSAVYEDRHNKLTLKHARANIIAETDYNIVVEFPLEQQTEEIDGIFRTVHKITLLGRCFTVGNTDGCNRLPSDTEEKELYFFWIKLPINVITTRYYAVKQNSITYNFEQAKDGAYSLLAEKELQELSSAEILSRTTEEFVKNGKYIISANYICLMDICEEQPIESDVPWENTDDMS